MKNISEKKRVPLYLRLANEMEENILDGTYKAGEKIPSIRQISEQRNISIMTVLKSYQELVGRGLISASPKSGYYVNHLKQEPISYVIPAVSRPKQVEVLDLARLVLLDSSNENLVPFGSGVPSQPLLPTQQLNRIMIRLLQSDEVPANITGNAEGSDNLRFQIAKHMFLFDTPVQPDDIIITSGCNEAIYMAFSAICKPGDLVAVESPCYFGTLQILQELGLKAIEIPSETDKGIAPATLRSALESNPIKAIFVNPNCNNPLGFSMPESRKKELAELTNALDVPLVEDDSIGDLYFSKGRMNTIKAYDKKGLVLYCSSFSKTLAPSYRIGWIAPGRYKEKIIQLKHAMSLSTPAVTQETIARYINSGQYERQMRKARQTYGMKAANMRRAILDTFPKGTRVSDPMGGMFLWVWLPEDVNAMELYQQARKEDISLAPGQMFSINDLFPNCLRMNTAFYTDETAVYLEQLARVIQRVQQR